MEKMMKIGEDYKFRDDMKNFDTVPIELLIDPWQGVILRYTQVGIKEQEDDTAVLKFQYDLIEMGNHTETNLRRSKKFEEFVGLILNHMILEVSEHDGTKSGKDNTEEFVEE
jgi:hypothetical protein